MTESLKDKAKRLADSAKACARNLMPDETCYYIGELHAAIDALAVSAPAGEAPEYGWKRIDVNRAFEALMTALSRADDKGYLPDAMREQWNDFDWRPVLAPQPTPAEPDAAMREALKIARDYVACKLDTSFDAQRWHLTVKMDLALIDAALATLPEPLAGEPDFKALSDRFLTWHLPTSVCSDTCVTNAMYKHARYGTNLLAAHEAEAMLRYVLAASPTATPKPQERDSPLHPVTLLSAVECANPHDPSTARLANAHRAKPQEGREPLTEEQITIGAHVLSEWLNDNAPIGERRYRDPAKAAYEAMRGIVPQDGDRGTGEGA